MLFGMIARATHLKFVVDFAVIEANAKGCIASLRLTTVHL